MQDVHLPTLKSLKTSKIKIPTTSKYPKKKKKNQKQRNITTNNTIKNKAKNGKIKQYLQQLISLK